MTTLVAPEDLPKWVPGRVLLSSDNLDWQGVSMRRYGYHGQDVMVPAMRDFMLVSYRDGVTPMQRRFCGDWSNTICGPGTVSLLTRSEVSHWNWTENVDVTHLYLSQSLMSDVATEVTGQPVNDVVLADVLRTDDPVISTAMLAIENEACGMGFGGALYVDALSRQIAIHLLRHYASVRFRRPERSGEFSQTQRRRIRDYIDAHLQETLRLDQMAAEMTLTPASFSRYFKRTFGVAPYAYVMERRLQRARRMLEMTSTSVKQIAAMCGFSDQAHLTRLFHRRFGGAPMAYRRALAGQ